MAIVFFDFDNTLTHTDTTLFFAYFLCKEKHNTHRYYCVIILFILYRLKIIAHQVFKQKLCKILVNGMEKDRIISLSTDFFNRHFNFLKNKIVVDKLYEHSQNGDPVYIISSNFDFLLKPIYNILPVKIIEATNTVLLNDFFTGELSGNVCSGDEKLIRAMRLAEDISTDTIISYGDSKDDYALMKKSHISYLIEYPDKTMAKKVTGLLKAFVGKFDFHQTRVCLRSLQE